MPRRTYDHKAGRRRPLGNNGDSIHALRRELARLNPAAHRAAADATVTDFQHRPDCRGSSITTFRGNRGDLMARCHACGALAVAQEAA